MSDSTAQPAPTSLSFRELALSPELIQNLDLLGYAQMTPIQAASLPLALAGRDVLGQAKTGSGKTAAFALALLSRLQLRFQGTQALVLCPTRELADQVASEIRRLGRPLENLKVLVLCGGTPIRPQLASLEHGAHVVVGTPGRVLDHLARQSLNLVALRSLVLDEADRMLDMGFHEDMRKVLSYCPQDRQTLLFSATYPEEIEELSRQFMVDPQRVQLLEQHAPTKIRQLCFRIEEHERLDALVRLLAHYRPARALAFCNTKEACREALERLRQSGVVALALHGDLDQRERDQVLIQFANRSCSVLVATDVAARGLDIEALEAVINVEMSPDPQTHLHRIGRTGRVDQVGMALSLVSPREAARVEALTQAVEWQSWSGLAREQTKPAPPPFLTLQILGGRKQKIRAGDVLGALTGAGGLQGSQVGKIDINEHATYVAIERPMARQAQDRLRRAGVKGRTVKVHLL